MTITTPPAGLPALSTNAGGIELDRLQHVPTPTSPASPGSPASSRSGATPPRRLSSELGGLNARRNSDPGPGPSRNAEAAMAPRRSLDQLRRPASTAGNDTPPAVPSTRSSSPAPTATSATTVATADHGHAPREAGAASFFLMQNVRHAIPVAGVRTVVQGVIAPELARAVVSHPDAALAAQTALTAYSLGRRIVSQIHSESSAQVANQAFAGDVGQQNNSVPRRIWQGIQSAGIAGGDFAALALTIASRSNPALSGVAQAAAAIQVIAHLQAQFREALRPAINTVHVGNGDPHVAQPPEGRNLRPSDVTLTMRGTFGAAAAVIDMGTQLLMQRALGGQPAWQAARGLAIGAGAIAGVGNMLTSSVEDHLVDTASARRMQLTDASHVRHLHTDLRNPFTRNELGRQAERADARVFNTMVPGLIALGVVQALQSTLSQPGVSPDQRQATQAGVHALVAGLVGGTLLALTVASYQMNDTVRSRNASQRAAAQRAQP